MIKINILVDFTMSIATKVIHRQVKEVKGISLKAYQKIFGYIENIIVNGNVGIIQVIIEDMEMLI